jgi:hypothetical protein
VENAFLAWVKSMATRSLAIFFVVGVRDRSFINTS